MLRDFAYVSPLGGGAPPQPETTELRAAGVHLERAYEVTLPVGGCVVTYIEAETAFEPADDPLELVGEWADPALTKHRQGLAVAFPLRVGQTRAFREFAYDAFHHRRFEHHRSRRALGLTREDIYLDGDVAVFYVEGDDPRRSFELLAESTAAHDIWFRDRCRALFQEGFDLDAPLPPIRTLWDVDLTPIPA